MQRLFMIVLISSQLGSLYSCSSDSIPESPARETDAVAARAARATLSNALLNSEGRILIISYSMGQDSKLRAIDITNPDSQWDEISISGKLDCFTVELMEDEPVLFEVDDGANDEFVVKRIEMGAAVNGEIDDGPGPVVCRLSPNGNILAVLGTRIRATRSPSMIVACDLTTASQTLLDCDPRYPDFQWSGDKDIDIITEEGIERISFNMATGTPDQSELIAKYDDKPFLGGLLGTNAVWYTRTQVYLGPKILFNPESNIRRVIADNTAGVCLTDDWLYTFTEEGVVERTSVTAITGKPAISVVDITLNGFSTQSDTILLTSGIDQQSGKRIHLMTASHRSKEGAVKDLLTEGSVYSVQQGQKMGE